MNEWMNEWLDKSVPIHCNKRHDTMADVDQTVLSNKVSSRALHVL